MKIQVEWHPLTRARKIEGRVLIGIMWVMVPASAFNAVRRFGTTWPALEWTVITALIALMVTALVLRVERAQREQGEKS